ncbi:MAG: hypothetical protein SOT71_07860 [Romboutsia timonensis]|uniref:hypothetical protein n=1 Tax=Romboutsia timonensis TaxID=1776391 RepID=UPI002A74ECCE|nr:hypothetical protein [Romboutsia timonensis]MDY2882552.1 hypothetical protein [Romboutsia timonensis]
MIDINFLKNASRCVLKDKRDPRASYLGFIHLQLVENNLEIASTDGRILYKKTIKDYVPKEEHKELLEKGVMVGFDFAKVKLKCGLVEFNFKDKFFVVREDNKPEEKYFYETTEAKFPNYNKVIPNKEKSKEPQKYYRFKFNQYEALEKNGFLDVTPVNNPEENEYFLLFDKPDTDELMVLKACL